MAQKDWRQVSQRLQEATDKSSRLHKIADDMTVRLDQLEGIREKDLGGAQIPAAELNMLMQRLQAVEAEKQSLQGSAQALSERMGRIEAPEVAKTKELIQEMGGLQDTVFQLRNDIINLERKLSRSEEANSSLQRELDTARSAPVSPPMSPERASSTKLIEKLQADLYAANAAAQASEGSIPGEVHRQACQEYEQIILDLQGKLEKSANGSEASPPAQPQLVQELRVELTKSVQEAQDIQFRLKQVEQALLERDQMLAANQQAMAEWEQKLVLAEQVNQKAMGELEQKLALAEQELGAERTSKQNLQAEISSMAGQAKNRIPVEQFQQLKESFEALKREAALCEETRAVLGFQLDEEKRAREALKAENVELQSAALRSVEEQKKSLASMPESVLEQKRQEIDNLKSSQLSDLTLEKLAPSSYSLAVPMADPISGSGEIPLSPNRSVPLRLTGAFQEQYPAARRVVAAASPMPSRSGVYSSVPTAASYAYSVPSGGSTALARPSGGGSVAGGSVKVSSSPLSQVRSTQVRPSPSPIPQVRTLSPYPLPPVAGQANSMPVTPASLLPARVGNRYART